MRLKLFTGSDARMLPQAFFLLRSLKDCGADSDLVFCDFGLTKAQRHFLERDWTVASIPPLSKEPVHPWMYKASFVDFIDRDVDVAVWIDADMIMLADPRPELREVAEAMAKRGRVIATCAAFDPLPLAHYLTWCATVNARIADFEKQLWQWRVPLHLPYLNSGFFLVRSRRWLKDWRRATLDAKKDEYLFEQNAFNLVAWRDPDEVEQLDLWRWNVHGPMLESIKVDAGGAITCRGRPVIGLHATSNNSKHLSYERHAWTADGQAVEANLRFFCQPELRALQLDLFSRFVAETHGSVAVAL